MANILEDYNNYLTENGKYNSSAYNALTDNKIDQNELVGIEKDPDAEDVKLTYDDDKVKEQEGYDWSKGFADFAKDIVPSAIYSTSNGLINILDVGVNLAPLGFKMIDAITPGDLSEPQQNFQQKMKNVSDFLAKPRDKNNERLEANSGAANFVSMVFQDLPAAVPIYRKLKSIGVPNVYALPISAGIGGAVTFGDEMSLGLNTETIKEFKNYIGLIEETPEEELFDVTYKAFIGTGLAFAIPGIWKAAKFVKNNVPKFKTLTKEVATATAAGGVLGKSIYDTLNPNEQSNFSKEKKTPELDDQSSIPGTVNEYGFEKTAGLNNLAVQFLKAGGKKVQDLRKLKGGTGRSVFELDNEKVIKIAKMQRGLRENDLEGDFVVKNWLPKFHTSGRDYVVVENVGRADKELRQFLKPLQKFNQMDFENKTPELQEAMNKMELGDFMNFELAWRDFIAARNWGKTKDGRFVLLDAGALDVTVLSRFLTSKKSIDTINDQQNILQKDWDKVLADRRREGMGKFIIITTSGGQGYRILDNHQNNIISKQTEN